MCLFYGVFLSLEITFAFPIMETYILIIEDDSILYESLRRFLVNQGFTIGLHTKSYDEAISSIKIKRPDLVLLDIKLEGDKDGIDLAKTLYKTYKIPFIYITDFEDEATFNRALLTSPTIYEVKTKPNIDTKHLLHTIKIILNNKNLKIQKKKGLMVCVDYLDKIKLYGKKDITRVPLTFKKIAFITTENYIDKKGKLNFLKDNYVRLETLDNNCFFYKSSLKSLVKIIPACFIRINESTIVNLSLKTFKGKINEKKLVINNHIFIIKDTYCKEVRKRISSIYQD